MLNMLQINKVPLSEHIDIYLMLEHFANLIHLGKAIFDIETIGTMYLAIT
jgi:hypothetical protein